MWMPPSHREPRTVRYWAIWAAIDAALGILFAVAATLSDQAWELVLAVLFGIRVVFDLIAMRRDAA